MKRGEASFLFLPSCQLVRKVLENTLFEQAGELGGWKWTQIGDQTMSDNEEIKHKPPVFPSGISTWLVCGIRMTHAEHLLSCRCQQRIQNDFKYPSNIYRESSVFFFEIRICFFSGPTWSWIEVVQTTNFGGYKVCFFFSDVIGNKRTNGQNSPMCFSTLVFFTLGKGKDPSSKPIVSCI